MLRSIFRTLTILFCFLPLSAVAQSEVAFVTEVAPAVSPEVAQLQIQGITKTLMAYPDQTPAILQNYIGIDTSKIDLDQFTSIVNRQSYTEISNEVSTLYNNRVAFNDGTFTSVSYYKQPVLNPTGEIISNTTNTTVGTVETSSLPPTGAIAAPAAESTATPAPETAAASTATKHTLSSLLLDTSVGTSLVVGGGIATAVAVGGGGGGGSGKKSSTTTSTSTPSSDAFGRSDIIDLYTPSSFVDSEFSAYNLNALSLSHAQYAYAKGLTGNGVKIGFHDFFSDDGSTNPEVSSRIIYRSLNIPSDTAFLHSDCQLYGIPEACNHGGAVMAYAANARNGSGTMGVAYEASLMMNSVFSSTTYAATLADQGANIINFSCGGCSSYGELQYIANQGVLMTSATGNHDPTDPFEDLSQPDPASPAYFATLLNYSLIAVTGTVSVSGVLVNPYHACGTRMQYCMTAYSDLGTSFAAPQIAGAAALIKDGWGFLTAPQIAKILLASAHDIGATGVDPVYGHGLLDIQAAVNPIGPISFMSAQGLSNFSSGSINQNQVSAFGNALSAPQNRQGTVVVVDSFGRDFAVKPQDTLHVAQAYKFTPETMPSFGRKAEDNVMRVNDSTSLHFSQQGNTTGVSNINSYAEYDVTPNTTYRLGFTTDINTAMPTDHRKFNTANFIATSSFKNGFLNVSDNDQVFHQSIDVTPASDVEMRFSTFYSKNTPLDYFNPVDDTFKSDFASSMLDTTLSPADDVAFTFKNGVTHEFNSVLGTQSSGAFDMGEGANTYFTGVDVSFDITPHWNIFGSYLFGATQVKPSSSSAFTEVSDIASDSFSVTATRDEIFGHDSLSFSAGQPTRVRSGMAQGLTQSVDHTTGAIGTTSFQQDLVPTGRTLQLQAAYQKDLSDDINMNLALEYETQPYQQKEADADVSGLMKLVYHFH